MVNIGQASYKVETPKISVVMPVFNQERYVQAAVNSILGQTIGDFEFIIVNDGSTDGTGEILGGVIDPRVRVISAPHRGFLKALELGVREAKGKWVARMDSDDITHPERLERQISFLEAHPECVFVASAYGIVTPNNKYISPRSSAEWRYLKPYDITFATYLFADPSAVFHRERAMQVGYDPQWENEKPLWYKLLGCGEGALLDEPLHYVRWLPNSHSRGRLEERHGANHDIRLKYDPVNAASLPKLPPKFDLKRSRISAASKSVNYYVLARDYAAARGVALGLLKKYPFSASTLLIAVKSTGLHKLLRHNNGGGGHKFSPVAQPW